MDGRFSVHTKPTTMASIRADRLPPTKDQSKRRRMNLLINCSDQTRWRRDSSLFLPRNKSASRSEDSLSTTLIRWNVVTEQELGRKKERALYWTGICSWQPQPGWWKTLFQSLFRHRPFNILQTAETFASFSAHQATLLCFSRNPRRGSP